MNARIARKIALMRASPQARHFRYAQGLYARTGSMAMAVGFWRPSLLVDPNLLGEDRTVQEFCRAHEGAHLALGHTRLLSAWKVLCTAAAGCLLLVPAVFTLSVPVMVTAFVVGAWLEAKFGALTLAARASAEQEADAVALSVMKPHAFATAIKTLAQGTEARGWWRRFEDRRLYGADWRARLARVGVTVPDRG